MLRDKALLIRATSAILAASLLVSIYIFFNITGLIFACLAVCLLSLREFKRLLFQPSDGIGVPVSFSLVSLLLVLALFIFKVDPLISVAVAHSLYAGFSIIFARERLDNERLLKVLCLGLFGLFYCVLSPWMAAQLLALENGAGWFLFLLLVVFSGDTFAYFGGRFFGKIKLNPSLSPKKTVEGAVAGIIGSVLASLLFWHFGRPDLPLGLILVFGILVGMIGQTGDLLMSLIKRISQVKDSGRLIPGHGGVLDRVDGVLLVAPLVYTLATLAH